MMHTRWMSRGKYCHVRKGTYHKQLHFKTGVDYEIPRVDAHRQLRACQKRLFS